MGVFLAYATDKGAAFIDRELYLPEEWAEDEERRRRARVPEEVGFTTKPQLAKKMLERVLGVGVSAAWVVADSVYGDTRRLGVWLEEREQAYVLAVSGKAHVWRGFYQPRVSKILDALREETLLPSALPSEGSEGWKRLSVGKGSKGERLYDWIRLELNQPLQEGFARWLLVRRSIDNPEELAAYVVFAPEQSTMEELAKIAGSRWKIEEAFEEAKGEVGLDHYEVRSWVGWHRHITLAMFAHAFLAAIRASGRDVGELQKGGLVPEDGKPSTSTTTSSSSSSSSSSSLASFKKRRGL